MAQSESWLTWLPLDMRVGHPLHTEGDSPYGGAIARLGVLMVGLSGNKSAMVESCFSLVCFFHDGSMVEDAPDCLLQ
jgi:hypothetical protein